MTEPQPTLVNSIHELIAGFIGNKFYNVLYNIAKRTQKAKGGGTITDYYKLLLSKMEGSIDTNITYSSEIRDMHEFIRSRASKLGGTFATFQHNLLSAFVPAIYLESMTEVDKDNIFNTIILSCYKNTIRSLRNQDNLRRVIDDRDNGAFNIRAIQDGVIKSLRHHRDDLYMKFAKQENKEKDAINIMSMEIQKLQTELHKRAALINAMQTKIVSLSEINGKLTTDLENSRQAQDDLRRTLATKGNQSNANHTNIVERKLAAAEQKNQELLVKIEEQRNHITQLEDRLSSAAEPIDTPQHPFRIGGQGEPANSFADGNSITAIDSSHGKHAGTDDSHVSDSSDEVDTSDELDEWDEEKIRMAQNARFGLK